MAAWTIVARVGGMAPDNKDVRDRSAGTPSISYVRDLGIGNPAGACELDVVNADRRRRRVAPPPMGGVGTGRLLAANAEGQIDRYARRAFRVDGDDVERELAGVDVFQRERRDEGTGRRRGHRHLAHDLGLPVDELDR